MIQWRKLADLGTSIAETFIMFGDGELNKTELINFFNSSYSKDIYPMETYNAIKELRKLKICLARKRARHAMKDYYSFRRK